MNIRSALALSASLAASALLSACGEPAEAPPPPPVSETVFGDTVGTMDRARAVEDVTLQQKQDIDRALEQAEGNGAGGR